MYLAQSEEPVSDETVNLFFPKLNEKLSTQTDENGVFSFDYLPFKGPFTVSAETADGLYASAGGVAVKSTSNASVNLKLFEEGTQTLRGVVRSSSGDVQANTFVTAVFTETDQEVTTLSDSSGRFEFDKLPEAETAFVFAALPETSATAAEVLDLSSDEEQVLELMASNISTNLTSTWQGQGETSTFDGASLEGLNLSGYNPSIAQPALAEDKAILNLGKVYSLNESGFLAGHLLTLPNKTYEGQYAAYLMTPRGPKVVGSGDLSSLSQKTEKGIKSIAFTATSDDMNPAETEGRIGLRVLAVSPNLETNPGIVLAEPSTSPEQIRTQQRRRTIATGVWVTPAQKGGLPTTEYFSGGGQNLWINVRNKNALGATLTLNKEYPCLAEKGKPRVIVQSTSATWFWSCFASTPVTWEIFAFTYSDVAALYYDVESTY